MNNVIGMNGEIRNVLAALGYKQHRAGQGHRLFNAESGKYCLESEPMQEVDFYSANGVLVGTMTYTCVRELAQ